MNKLIAILIVLKFLSPVFGTVKGVSPVDQEKYQPDPNGNWHCLNDSTIVISFDKINDNYCDCPDGSDEPDTNACPNGIHFCENIGFKSQYISSNRVNDGVCDYSICCDGSDEPIGFCENRCEAMNIENQKMIVQKNNVIANGLKEKEKIMKNSSDLKKKLTVEIENINNKIDNINSNLENLNNLKQILIKNSNNNDELILEKFRKLDQNLKDFEKFNEDFNKVNDLSNNVDLLESILKKMSDEYNHDINDPAVKAAENSFLHYFAKKMDSNDASIEVQNLINGFKTNIDSINNEINNIKSNLIKDISLKDVNFNDDLISETFSRLDQNLKNFGNFNENLNKVNDLSSDLNLLESVLKKMADEYNHNFNDPAVKTAANSFLHYYAKKIDSNDANIDVQDLVNDFEKNINSINTEISNIKSNLIESINSQDSNINLNSRLLEYKTHNDENDIKNKELTFKDLVKSGLKKLLSFFFGIQKHSIVEPGIESNELTELEVNNKIDFFGNELKILEENLKSKNTELNKNYGPNDILRSLNDCIINKVGNYNYKLCLNSHLEQIDENGVITKIGFFNSIVFDEETNNYKIFFKNGQRCWNGPLREGIVTINCGEKQEIKLVTEPEKCQYHVNILSPIACFENDIV